MGSLGCGQDPLSVPEARCSRWGYTWEHQVVDAAPVLRPVELEPGPLLLDDLRGVATNFPPPNLDGFRARSGWGVVILHG